MALLVYWSDMILSHLVPLCLMHISTCPCVVYIVAFVMYSSDFKVLLYTVNMRVLKAPLQPGAFSSC